MRLSRLFFLVFVSAALSAGAAAQDFPRVEDDHVTDAANVLPPQAERALEQRLARFEAESGRQFVIATIPDLQGYDIADYGYRLGREWEVGSEEEDDGILLLVAPNERKVRIEVGYGLEGVMTDALSSRIIRSEILPRFRDGNLPAGIAAGAGAVLEQLALPPEEAAARLAEAEEASGGRQLPFGLIWILFIVMFTVLPLLARAGDRAGPGRGRRRRRGPVILFGPGMGGFGGGRGGGFGGSGGFGGFSGGGGSFGGGGASGGW
ncbi:methanol dehydrogenase [Pacificimonas flava]|uniref:Methanol dehydrogenase n=2 Tax=Pacificimonas TaxID=1960290 RepID=A0A219B3I7_9SPHN|nr:MULTISPECIES: TPM domain-containing protein [Pacificimonas]MBZ6377615.1 TPM domain-containing protein [Pacificimonas aurantium]OWV32696.1 methanol dehydrogenase [Pacificimonas flava]